MFILMMNTVNDFKRECCPYLEILFREGRPYFGAIGQLRGMEDVFGLVVMNPPDLESSEDFIGQYSRSIRFVINPEESWNKEREFLDPWKVEQVLRLLDITNSRSTEGAVRAIIESLRENGGWEVHYHQTKDGLLVQFLSLKGVIGSLHFQGLKFK